MVFPPGRTPPREREREGEGEHTQVERSHVLPTVLRAAPRVLPRARNKPALLLRVIENFRQTRSKPLPRWLPSHRAGRDCDRSIGNKCTGFSRYENLLASGTKRGTKPIQFLSISFSLRWARSWFSDSPFEGKKYLRE